MPAPAKLSESFWRSGALERASLMASFSVAKSPTKAATRIGLDGHA
jgi:hypothetical protein